MKDLVSISQNLEDWPKISIITPSFNQVQFIEETILSVLNQKYPNLEYIIIDGGSSDGTIDFIKKYEDKITYWISEKDYGQSYAINKGLQRITGEIISWLNSDDIFADNALYTVASAFKKNHSQLIVGGSLHWDMVNQLKIPHESNPKTFKDLLRYHEGICLPQPSVFYTRKLLSTAGYLNNSLHFTMDLDLWLKFGLIEGADQKITYIPELLSLMRLHSDQKTFKKNFDAMKEASMVVLKYSKKYRLNWRERLILFFKNRLFRYNMSLHNKDRFRFLDIIIYSKLKKIF